MSFICDPDGNITKGEDQKTIRTLCKEIDDCDDCPFQIICGLSPEVLHAIFHGKADITKAIIETARRLEPPQVD